jgi:hypothetical protein
MAASVTQRRFRSDRSWRSFGEPTITLEAKAWLKSLSCRKAKELGYPHELWTTRLLARHAREHGPAEGHPCLANTKMAVARVAAPDWSCAGSRGGGANPRIERQDVEGIRLDFVIVLARVQDIEIGNTVNPIRRQWFAKRKSIAAVLKEVMTNVFATPVVLWAGWPTE